MRRLIPLVLIVSLLSSFPAGSNAGLVVAAVYPTTGPQMAGGTQEYRGAALAAEFANRRGGVNGSQVQLKLIDSPTVDTAKSAVARAHQLGARLVIGSYGSGLSRKAAVAADERGMIFWETGAVGDLSGASDLFFRAAPSGLSLGKAAVDFVESQLLEKLGAAGSHKYSVVYIDDDYGRSVAHGAIDELGNRGLAEPLVVSYRLPGADYEEMARAIADAGTEVLIVAQYLEDSIALRKAVKDVGLQLVASVGTSSSYCMPAFGARLGIEATGLFASDKPDGTAIDPSKLSSDGRAGLEWAISEYRLRFGSDMSSAALSGFAGGWALFGHVLPNARGLSAKAIVEAARAVDLPAGSLPDGAGLKFSAGLNTRAANVIWQWQPGPSGPTREVVWPPAFATSNLLPIRPN